MSRIVNKPEPVTGTIWTPGTHHMWLDHKPTRVHATAQSVQKDYEILKKNLPVPFGIDHLDDDIIEKNPILKKMNLLNVGQVTGVKLENNHIKITDSEITNPLVQKLYDDGELQAFSNVSDMYTRKCQTGKADAVEEFSVINRVDFVGKGACETCKVDLPVDYASIPQRAEAKAIIGDDTMATDPNANPEGEKPNPEGSGEAEPTMQDVLTAVNGLVDALKPVTSGIKAIEGALKIKEVPEGGAQPPEGQQAPAAPAAASNSDKPSPAEARIAALEDEIKKSKAEAKKAEATALVNGFIKEGKVKPAMIEQHVAMAMATPEQYAVAMKDAPVIIDMERHSAAAGNSGSTIKDEDGEDVDLEATAKEMDKIIGDA